MSSETPSPLRIVFPGPVAGLEDAAPRRGWVRLAGLRLGPHRIGPALSSHAMLAALRQAEAEADAAIRLGHLPGGRWVLSVSRGGRTARAGIIGFLLCNLLMGFAFTLPALALGEAMALALGRAHTVMWPFHLAGAGWMAVVAVNYAAWFGLPRR